MKFSLSNLYSREKKQNKSEPSIIEKRWGTIVTLLGIFTLALFIRGFFAFDLAIKVFDEVCSGIHGRGIRLY